MKNSNKILIALIAAVVVLIIVFAIVVRMMLEDGQTSGSVTVEASGAYSTGKHDFSDRRPHIRRFLGQAREPVTGSVLLYLPCP